MKKLIVVCLVLASVHVRAQEIPVIKFDKLQSLLQSHDKEILVVNFWATWCAPCVKELPLFEAVNSKQSVNTRVVLINLDFADKVDRVKSFVKRKNINSEVLLLDEVDYNSWISKIDESWQGAIPATLVKNTKTGKIKFVANELKEGDLERIIDEILKP